MPEEILRAASAIKIAVVDTGLDVTHPDIAAKAPETWDIVHHRTSVVDKDGHGTFVSSLAAGSVNNGEGIAGFGGDAQLLMVKAVGAGDSFSDVDESAAIVYAVDHGANIINLSIGGEGTSPLEQRALEYAASHNVLLVAAAGNEYEEGNPVEYPAAALQPVGSKGQGGIGLSVAASTIAGKRAHFSNTGSADLSCRARRPRLRRRRRDLRRLVAPLRDSPARSQASTAGRAGPRSRAPRSPARPRSSGPPIRRSLQRRSPGSSRRPHRPTANGLPGSVTA